MFQLPSGGARLLIKAEYNPHKQNLYLNLDRLELKNLERFIDKCEYEWNYKLWNN